MPNLTLLKRPLQVRSQNECITCKKSFIAISYNSKLRKYCSDKCKQLTQKVCSKCKLLKLAIEFGPNAGKSDKLQTYCKECRRPWGRQRYSQKKEYLTEQGARNKFSLKLQFLKKLGGKCNVCGNSNLYHLQIDHKFDDGKIDREKGCMLSTMIRKYLRGEYDINRLQCLCANCNMEKQLRKYKFFPKFVEEIGI